MKNIKKIIGVKMDKANKVILDKWKEWVKEEGRDEESKNSFANYYANSYEEKKPSWCSMNTLVTGAILMKLFNSFKICSKQQ